MEIDFVNRVYHKTISTIIRNIILYILLSYVTLFCTYYHSISINSGTIYAFHTHTHTHTHRVRLICKVTNQYVMCLEYGMDSHAK
jgi:hypothetical protein